MLKKVAVSNWRQRLTTVASFFIAYIIMLTGIFSYFHGEDVSTKRLHSVNNQSMGLMVAVREPLWDGVTDDVNGAGCSMAQNYRPGMEIPKNPMAVNLSESTGDAVDEYVRLVLSVSFPAESGDKDIILGSIKYKNSEEQYVPLLTKLEDGSYLCANPNFAVKESNGKFYFYYVDSNKIMKKLSSVNGDNVTSELFHRVDIPASGDQYKGTFDKEFNINISAQAIVADVENLSVEDAVGQF